MKKRVAVALLAVAVAQAGLIPGRGGKKDKPKKEGEQSALDQYLKTVPPSPAGAVDAPSPGSIWSPEARLADLSRDLRASQVDDVVTIVVTESINAVASGASTSERASSANSSIASSALNKVPSVASAISNLATLSGDQKLNGTGTTSRAATFTTTMTARVIRVMPGGLLLIQGDKNIQINSETQAITIRGLVRTADINTNNAVASTQIGDLEVRLNGKGVVGDAVRRPNALYRLLLGVLPF
jgi:flagellar L-ring protein precursor FlgH